MGLRWVALVTLTAACSGNKPEQLCRKISASVCDHQLQCDIVSDVFTCEQEFEDRYLCDPEATEAELQQCIDAAKILECPTSIPFVCFEVLCDEDIGCIDTPTTPPDDTDTDTDPDTDTDATP